MNDFPNDFESVARSGDQIKPISSVALMQNFAWAKLDVDPTLIVDGVQCGYPARKLAIPAVPQTGNVVLAATTGSLSWKADIPEAPASGTYVLGAVSGSIQWLSTEAC